MAEGARSEQTYSARREEEEAVEGVTTPRSESTYRGGE
jgi:hypothetical protein